MHDATEVADATTAAQTVAADLMALDDVRATPGDGHAWFTDGMSVAWRLDADGGAHLVGYGGASLRDAPRFLRRAVSLDQAIAAILPDPASPVPGLTDQVRDDRFSLTIATDRSTYSPTDWIPVSASLAYLGAEPITVRGTGSGLVLFGVKQLDGPVDAGPSMTLDCHAYPIAPGEVVDVPFRKSGGYDMSDLMAPFWIAWFNDADLLLPPGRCRIFALAPSLTPDCGDARELVAEIVVEVIEVEPSPEAAAS